MPGKVCLQGSTYCPLIGFLLLYFCLTKRSWKYFFNQKGECCCRIVATVPRSSLTMQKLSEHLSLSLQPPLCDFSGPFFHHPFKTELNNYICCSSAVSRSPLPRSSMAFPSSSKQSDHHIAMNTLCTWYKDRLGFSLLIYSWSCQISMFNTLFGCKRCIQIA